MKIMKFRRRSMLFGLGGVLLLALSAFVPSAAFAGYDQASFSSATVCYPNASTCQSVPYYCDYYNSYCVQRAGLPRRIVRKCDETICLPNEPAQVVVQFRPLIGGDDFYATGSTDPDNPSAWEYVTDFSAGHWFGYGYINRGQQASLPFTCRDAGAERVCTTGTGGPGYSWVLTVRYR